MALKADAKEAAEVPRCRVPNTFATSPLVSGTVPSHVSPITAAKITTEAEVFGSRKNAPIVTLRMR